MKTILVFVMVISTTLPALTQELKGRGVLDPAGIDLDSSVLSLLKGEWRVKSATQTLRDSTREVKVRFWRVSFLDDDFFLAKACSDCIQREEGVWKVVENRWIKINSTRDYKRRGDFELDGDWMVHEITSEMLVLSKKLTTTGSWAKTWTFERVD